VRGDRWYVTFLGSIVAVLAIATGCTTPPAPTAGQSPADAATVAEARLATGLSRDYFLDIIGRKPEITRAAGNYEEALWIDRTWAVQAIIGPYGEVQGYSVTTRDPQFQPLVEQLGDLPLGVTSLDGFGLSPAFLGDGVGRTAGPNWFYTAASPPAGVTNERSLVLTASDGSDVGVTTTLEVVDRLTEQFDASTSTKHGPLYERTHEISTPDDRNQIIPTTYSVIGPTLTIDDLPGNFRFGPTFDDVIAVVGTG
jgi:hypothetical protein